MCGIGKILGKGSASLNQYLTGHIQYTAATILNMKNSGPYSGKIELNRIKISKSNYMSVRY